MQATGKILWCTIKILGRQGWTPSVPSPQRTTFTLYPPPILRCFWKDSLMIPHHPTSSIFHCYTPPPPLIQHPCHPGPIKILIIHMFQIQKLSYFIKGSFLSRQKTPGGALNTLVYGDVSPIFLGIFFFLILIFLGQ